MAKTAKTTSQAQAPSQAKAKRAARIQVRRSGVHGKGVYALQAFEPGDFVIEYKGEHISWEEMERRHEAKEGDPFHTFFFQTESGNVIDGGGIGRNAARWINHSCEANCETQEDDDGHVFITAIAPIAPGEEFFYYYALEIDEPLTAELKNDYACRCGSPNCRGTMLKTRRKAVKKTAAKKPAAKKTTAKQSTAKPSTAKQDAASPTTASTVPPATAPSPRKPRAAAKRAEAAALLEPTHAQQTKQAVKKIAQKPAKDLGKQVAQHAAQKALKKAAKKSVPKTVKKSATQALPEAGAH